MTGSGGTVGNAIVDHPDIALITFTGSPEVGWGIRARAPRKRVGLELGNNAPGHHRARRRLDDGGGEDPRRRLRPRRAELHLDAADLRAPLDRRRVHRRARRPRRRSAGRRRPDGRGHRRVGADLASPSATGSRRGSTRPDAGAPRWPPAATLDDDGVLAPDGAHRRHARHEGVLAGGVRPGGRRRRATTTSTRRCALANDIRVRPAGGDLHHRHRQGPAGRPAPSTSAGCSSTRCRRGGPTSSPTAASATAATPARARPTPSAR